MMLRRPVTSSLLGLALVGLALACGSNTATFEEGETTEGRITVPRSGLVVEAEIAAVSLSGAYTSLQVSFVASAGTEPAPVQVEQVALVDAATDADIETLTASEPTVWNGSSYEPWNQKVTPGGDLRASYVLTSPQTTSGRRYGVPFKVRLTLLVGGERVVLFSDEVQREPEAVT